MQDARPTTRRRGPNRRSLFYRVITSLALIPVIVVFVYLGGWPLFGVAVVVTIIGTREFCQIVSRAGQRPLYLPTIILALLFVLDAQMTVSGLSLPGGAELSRVTISLAILGSLIWLVLTETDARQAISSWAFLFAGALYVGWLFRYYLLLRGLGAPLATPGSLPGAGLSIAPGAFWLGLVLIATWLCDTTAYFIGSYFGNHRMIERISPSKTWEGTVAGVTASTLWVAVTGPLLGLGFLDAVGLGLCIGVAAVFGDLAESLIKRGAHVKDASSLIPGHGGLLDRLDSMLFTGVTAYYYLVLTQTLTI